MRVLVYVFACIYVCVVGRFTLSNHSSQGCSLSSGIILVPILWILTNLVMSFFRCACMLASAFLHVCVRMYVRSPASCRTVFLDSLFELKKCKIWYMLHFSNMSNDLRNEFLLYYCACEFCCLFPLILTKRIS